MSNDWKLIDEKLDIIARQQQTINEQNETMRIMARGERGKTECTLIKLSEENSRQQEIINALNNEIVELKAQIEDHDGLIHESYAEGYEDALEAK